jgi:hypothetical protein
MIEATSNQQVAHFIYSALIANNVKLHLLIQVSNESQFPSEPQVIVISLVLEELNTIPESH